MKNLSKIIVILFVLNSIILCQKNPYPEFIPYLNNKTEKDKKEAVKIDIKELGKEEAARWLSVDPLADKYPGWSPYNYTLCNPLKYVDPNGMWVASTDSSGNIIVTYEEGDTYKDLYTQLGISAEDFSDQFGIDISKGISTTSFDITSNVLKNSNFSKDANGMNCFSSCLTGTGAMSEEMQIMGGFNFTESLQEGFGYEATQNSTTGTISTWKDSKGVTHHAAINVITSRNGTQYFYGRPGPGGSVGLQNSNSTSKLYPGFTKTYLKYTKTKPLF